MCHHMVQVALATDCVGVPGICEIEIASEDVIVALKVARAAL